MEFLKENNKNRKKYFPVGGRSLKLPIYLPSISSVKTGKIDPFDYYNMLSAMSPHFLVSAYDIHNSKRKKKFISALKKNMSKDERAIIILDSGNYEKFWLEDDNWKIQFFNSIIKENICDLAFCYDNQKPPDIKKNIRWIAKSVNASQKEASSTSIIPIVHSKKKNDVVKSVMGLKKVLNFSTVAIPERELGNGVIERTKIITELRKALNEKNNEYTYIHVLGTGNPLSLLLFSFAGADTFDGLEWCQTVVDPKTSLLYHFQQRELIQDDCGFCSANNLDYNTKTLGHNLLFYLSWMNKIQEAIELGNEEKLLEEYFTKNIISQLQQIWK